MSYVQAAPKKEDSAGPRVCQSAAVEGRPYKGPLNWLPDRCCRIEGLELAASPSFLQTTCGQVRQGVSGKLTPSPRTPRPPPSAGSPRASGRVWVGQGPRDAQTRFPLLACPWAGHSQRGPSLPHGYPGEN